MNSFSRNTIINIAVISLIAMFFSCTNNTQKVRDFLADKNMPIGISKNAYHVYKDSGRITSRLKTPLLHDFSNRKEHPYKEFPKGILITTISDNGLDSTTVSGNYAITYDNTAISEIKGNVVVFNHKDKIKLQTNQLFWDQKEAYYFTEDGFRLTTPKDTINGYGFESSQDLKKWIAKDITGDIEADQNEL